MKEEKIITDEDLDRVALCRKGDLNAFEELVRRHQKKMINAAYRITGSYEDACEVVQDAFVSAYKSIKGFEGKSRFETWLYAIVINLSRNRLKQMRSQNYHEAYSMDDPIETGDGNIKPERASDEPSALSMLEQAEVQKRVQGCIKALDDEFREVLVLRDIQGFAYDEIGVMLKLAEGTVKSRLFRARDAVKNCLKKALGGL